MNVITTTTLLLDGLFDATNEAVWREFDARYRPIITAFCRRVGLSDHDAADVAQETLLRFVKAYRAGRYDRSKGRLRAWIIGIVRYRVAEQYAARGARREVRGDSAIGALPSVERLTQLWDEEHERELLKRAFQELRANTRTSDTTVAAFEMFVLQQQPAAAVATSLGLTPHDVYMAKRRVTQRLREIVGRLEATYGDGS